VSRRPSLTDPTPRLSVRARPSSAGSSIPPSISTFPGDPWADHIARVGEAPESGTVRGLFFTEILRLVPALQNARARYVAFSKYPLRDYMRLLIEAGRIAHPGKSPDESLRQLGLSTFGAFSSSIVGVALFSGVKYERALDLAPEAYRLSIAPARIEMVSRTAHEAVVQLRDLWAFPESYQVGVWTGGLRVLGLSGDIECIRHSWSSVDFHVTFQRGPAGSP